MADAVIVNSFFLVGVFLININLCHIMYSWIRGQCELKWVEVYYKIVVNNIL